MLASIDPALLTIAPPAAATRYDRRKDAIINAAAGLINRLGLRDTTLAVVALEIGLNLKSLRHYFARREDLVAATFLRSIALHRSLVDEAMAAPDPAARIRRFTALYFALQARVALGEHPPFVYFGDLRALTSLQIDTVGAEYTQLFRALRRMIRGDTPVDRMTLNAHTHMLLSQLLWSVVWMSDYLPEDLPRVADRFTDILLNGIAAGPVDLAACTLPPLPPPATSERLTHESFLRAATELINAQGYRGAAVDRISSQLNVTKGAFYHHNDTRDALVVACFDRTFGFIRAAQNAALGVGGASDLDPLGQVCAAAASLVDRQMSPEGVLLRTSALTAVGPELRGELAARMALFTTRFAGMLNEGLIDGSVRGCDVRIAAEMVTGMINSAEELDRWVPGLDRGNASAIYVQPLLVGLAAGLKNDQVVGRGRAGSETERHRGDLGNGPQR